MMTATHTDTRDQRAASTMETCGYAAAAVSLLPIPGLDLIAVMPLHVGMVVKLGDIYDVEIDRQSATHLILRIGATVGLSLVGSRLAISASKFLLPIAPLAGIVAAPFMYASTQAIGRIAQAYFSSGGLTDGEMKDIYKRTVKTAKKQFDPKKARSKDAREKAAEATQPAQASQAKEESTIEERLERLASLRDKGLIQPEEFEARRQSILSEV